MGRHHGRIFTQQVKGAAIVALCDPNAENLTRYQREIFDPVSQRPATFADYRQMLADVEMDAVVIVTPHTQHFAQAMDSLAAGCNVLLEKPMVTAVAHARALIACARQKKRIVSVAFPGAFTPEFAYIRRLVTRGELGAVRLVDAFSVQNWLKATIGTWRQDPKLSGGGQAYDTGAHMFFGILYLTDLQPLEVFAMVDHCGTPVDINSVATIKLAGGAIATATVSGADVCRWDNAIYLSGKDASVRTGIHGGRLEQWNAHGDLVKYPPVTPVPFLQQAFVDCVNGRIENICPPLWGLRHAQLMDAFYKSARTGKPAKIAPE